ncbi:MAG: hypothetical protein DRQ51_01290 [Gammaproteobacteria bacterium]|nr:MAG: hypothetical protein DRQ51_01290 [Gammaproteobacteria bacterium]
MKKLIIFAIALFYAMPAISDDKNNIQVELIIFKHLNVVKNKNTDNNKNTSIPETEQYFTLKKLEEYGFKITQPTLLKDVLDKLKSNEGKYKIIKYISYIQPVVDVNNPVRITNGKEHLIFSPTGILNAINIKYNKTRIIAFDDLQQQWRQQFVMKIINEKQNKLHPEFIRQIKDNNSHNVKKLHEFDGSILLKYNDKKKFIFYVDVVMLKPTKKLDQIINIKALDFLDSWFAKLDFKKTNIYRLQQNQTIELGENYYFDHPYFGIIMQAKQANIDN